MGRPGQPRKPTALHKLQGTYRADRALPNEVKPPPGCPKPPVTLDAEGMRAWAYLSPQLEPLGLLTKVDGYALAGLCRSVSVAVAADAILAKDGLMVPGRFDLMTEHPMVKVSKTAWAEVRAFCTEFGLSPAARTRIGAPTKGKSDDAENFFFGGLSVVNGDDKP